MHSESEQEDEVADDAEENEDTTDAASARSVVQQFTQNLTTAHASDGLHDERDDDYDGSSGYYTLGPAPMHLRHHRSAVFETNIQSSSETGSRKSKHKPTKKKRRNGSGSGGGGGRVSDEDHSPDVGGDNDDDAGDDDDARKNDVVAPRTSVSQSRKKRRTTLVTQPPSSSSSSSTSSAADAGFWDEGAAIADSADPPPIPPPETRAVPLHPHPEWNTDDTQEADVPDEQKCFLCWKTESSEGMRSNPRFLTLVTMTRKYGEYPTASLVGAIQEYYDTKIRAVYQNYPFWSRRRILEHMEDHINSPEHDQHMVRSTLRTMFLYARDKMLCQQNIETGEVSMPVENMKEMVKLCNTLWNAVKGCNAATAAAAGQPGGRGSR